MLLTITSKINAIKEFIKAGDYDSAVEIAERINPEKVSSVSDLYTIAKAFLKKRRLEDAKEIYIEVHNHVVNHKVLVGLIELCLKTNCPEEAETYIREFRKLEPDNPERLIYRYRVDVLLGKGPEYLVKSLSKLKDEDYTDVWALELAKAYFKMDDYQKCAQECKDILLWFAGSESAAKAHILLSACAEKGVTITMPEAKPHHDEDYYDDEPTPDVPVIGAELEEKVEEDTTFFDVAAAIGEAVSETIDEDAAKAAETENEMPYSFAEANNNEEGYAPVEDNGEQSSAEEEPEEESEEESEEEYYDLEAVSEIHFAAEALEAANDEGLGADEEKAARNDTEDDNEEDVPEDATETLTFLFKYYEEENRRKAEEAPAEEMAEEFVGEELAEESSEDELVEDELTEEEIFDKELVEDELTEEEASEDELAEESEEDESDTEAAGSEGFFEENSEEPADESSDVLPVDESSDEMERTMIALAIKKAKEADDDEDDIVFHDYYPRAAYKNLEGKNRVLPLRTEALQPKKPVAAAPVAPTETVTPVEEEEVITPSEEQETAEFADFDELAAEEQRKDFAESISESIALSLEKDEVKDKELDVEGEEEDGQLSFLSMDEDADMKISFSRRERNEEAEDDMFGISGAIAESVREEIESGNTEADDVSASPTKIHGELTAQVLDAMLREDDEAVEKALYGLLADK